MMACIDFDLPGGAAEGATVDDAGPLEADGGLPPVTIVIDELAFTPKEAHVRVGQEVIWDMRDTGTFHFVVEGSPGGGMPDFESPRLDTGRTWSRVFNSPGTYLYYCSNHSTVMRGAKIVVEP
ncbi:MAG: hypothetical protein HYV07_17000 [Deltaproteobacteria bacterium]|nr:hypothetical protein [Deltaproteobacteria bacterium]